MAFKQDACTEKVASGIQPWMADAEDATGSAQSDARAAAPNATWLAPGARMTRVQTTSLTPIGNAYCLSARIARVLTHIRYSISY